MSGSLSRNPRAYSVFTFALAALTHQGLAQGRRLLPDAPSNQLFSNDFNNLTPLKDLTQTLIQELGFAHPCYLCLLRHT